MTVWLRMSNYTDTACPLGLFDSKQVLVSFIFYVFDDVSNTITDVILRAAIVVLLVFRVVKLTVSDGAKSDISAQVISCCKAT